MKMAKSIRDVMDLRTWIGDTSVIKLGLNTIFRFLQILHGKPPLYYATWSKIMPVISF